MNTTNARLRPLALTPAAFAFALAIAALAPILDRAEAAPWLAVSAVSAGIGVVLVGLWKHSYLLIDDSVLTVRFMSIRAKTLAWSDVRRTTFGMTFPSISYALRCTSVDGREVLIHANWWRDQGIPLRRICSMLLKFDVDVDRATAYVIGRELHVPRPEARVLHRPLFRRDKPY